MTYILLRVEKFMDRDNRKNTCVYIYMTVVNFWKHKPKDSVKTSDYKFHMGTSFM